ncbi:MAG: hypothetical protein FIA92_14520 [Chloroflexi bacterium]|nr:hypothetical protein [Chloroflexota bacterium]
MGRLAAPLRHMSSADARRLASTLDPAPDRDLPWYRATLRQGWKRQIRRMFGAVGAPIVRLVRVRIGPVELGSLRSGRARRLKAPEVAALSSEPKRTARPSRRPRRS